MQIFYGFMIEDTRNDDKGSLKVYFKSTVKIKQTVLDYSLVSFLAEIGGYTGLFMGVAVLDINSILDLIQHRCANK